MHVCFVVTGSLGMCLLTSCTDATFDTAPVEDMRVAMRAVAVNGSNANCGDCELTLDYVVELGRGANEVGGPADFSHVAWGSDGRFYLAPSAEPGVIEVYDSAGTRVLAFGRGGRGPGELAGLSAAVRDAAGRILVIDGASRTPVMYFDSTGRYIGARQYPVGMVQGAQASSIGVIVGALRTKPDVLVPGILIANDSIVEFAVEQPRFGLRTAWEGSVTELDGEVWFARGDGRQLVAFAPDGTERRRYTREPTRFREYDGYVNGLTAVEHYLAVIGLIKNPKFVVPKGWPVDKRLTPELANQRLDTRIDIVEPHSGKLVAAFQLDVPIVGIAGSGLVVTEAEDDAGGLRLRVSRLRLRSTRTSD